MRLLGVPLPRALLRGGLRTLLARRARRFTAALRDPAAAQTATLARLTQLVAGSPYARSLGYAAGGGYAAFAAAVPIVEYEDLRPWIDRQIETGVPMLTWEAPALYERTSGSSGRAKLVPYPPALLAAFNSCFLVWAHDLVARGPRFRTGRLFFSVSPPFQEEERTATGTPVSLADDAAYLAPWLRRLLHGAFFVPPEIKRIGDGEDYRSALAAILVAEERLEIISVWSPTYLLALLETITTRRDVLAADLRRGWTGPQTCRLALPAVNGARLALLQRDPIPWEELWPELKLLSCWTDGASAAFVPNLHQAFPTVAIQGKGLLATEAPMTVPRVEAPAPVPLLDEVFFEFERGGGPPLRLHELEDGGEYTVIVSQAGGFLRYRTNDRVRVEGRVGPTPCLRFLGRVGVVSDLVGEKLGEEFVRAALASVLGSPAHCAFILPELRAGEPPHYHCITDHPRAAVGESGVAECLDAVLREAFHYGQARRLGQLGPVRVSYRLAARRTYEEIQLARGLKWGNIKFAALLPAVS